MMADTRIAVVEIGVLREMIREVMREELEKQSQTQIDTITYKDTDKLNETGC
jgi:hypothetical protein